MQVKLMFNLLLFSTCCFCSANAQTWRSLNGPFESDVRDIAIKNDTVYVAAWNSGGISKKKLYSNQWFYSEIAEGEGAFRKGLDGALSIDVDDDGNYYVGSVGIVTIGDGQAYDHFFRSKDYGKTWSEFRNGIEECHTVNDILITNENALFIGCISGVFKFSETENTFERVGNKYGETFLFQHQKIIIAGTDIGVEYSEDSGNTWKSSGPDSVRVYSITFAEEAFFFGTNHGLYTADSLEGQWSHFEGMGLTNINSLYNYNNSIIVGTDSGIVSISPDNFEVQSIFPSFLTQHINVITAFEETIYIGSKTGFYSCSLEQNKCTKDGVPSTRIRTINFQNEDTLLAGATQGIHRYFVDIDRWDTLSVPVASAENIISVGSDSILTVSDRYFFSCSFEHGNCDSTRFTGPGTVLFDLKQNTGGDLFIASQEHVFKSTDKGKNWEIIYTNPDNINFSLFTFSDSLLFINGGDLIKYSLYTDTYKTLNNGVSIITSDGTIYAAVNGIQKSTDFGESWTTILQSSDIINSETDGLKFLLYDENAQKLYAISLVGRVYVTENEGKNWGVNQEMYNVYMESAAIGPDGTLYLGSTSGGVFANTKPFNPPITISNEVNNPVPKIFTLSQNYPNPFNPTTTIPFTLNQAQEVQITTYNVFGQKIREYNLGLKNAGSHDFQIKLQNQASGVYFVRVKAGRYFQTIKISFIK